LALRYLVPGIPCRNPPPPRRDALEKALFAYGLADIRMERSSLEGAPCSKYVTFDFLSGSVYYKKRKEQVRSFFFLKNFLLEDFRRQA